jgi:hypothetical protein
MPVAVSEEDSIVAVLPPLLPALVFWFGVFPEPAASPPAWGGRRGRGLLLEALELG